MYCNVLYLPFCVCVRVSVRPEHSLLIWFGEMSMLQACMIKHSGLNVKPYRNHGSLLGSQCVCVSTVALSLVEMLSGCCGL